MSVADPRAMVQNRIEQNRSWGTDPLRARCTQALKQALCAPYSVPDYRSPVPLIKFQMAPTPSTLISSGSKKKEPRYLCLSEVKASHSHKICTEVSSSVPHFLQEGSLLSPITCRYLLRVLCLVSRPITALICVLWIRGSHRIDQHRQTQQKTGPSER